MVTHPRRHSLAHYFVHKRRPLVPAQARSSPHLPILVLYVVLYSNNFSHKKNVLLSDSLPHMAVKQHLLQSSYHGCQSCLLHFLPHASMVTDVNCRPFSSHCGGQQYPLHTLHRMPRLSAVSTTYP